MKIKDLVSLNTNRAEYLKAWSIWQKSSYKKLGYGANVFNLTKGSSYSKVRLDDDQYLLIDKAVTMLKGSDDYNLIVEHYVKGLSVKQIAKEKKISLVRVYTKLDNAQTAFYQNLLELI